MTIKMSIDGSEFSSLMKKIDQLPRAVSVSIRRKVMPAAVAYTEHVMRAKAPKSKSSDTAKQSRRHKTKWANTPQLQYAILGVIRDYDIQSFTAFVGVENPWGNKSYFDYHGTKDRNMVFWGKYPASPRTRKKFRWMVSVADAVRPVVIKMFKDAIDSEVANHIQKAAK